jgi:hypothetical protein
MVSAGCALVSRLGGVGTEVGVSPMMGLKIRKDAGHWFICGSRNTLIGR